MSRIEIIDCQYLRPRFAASFLLTESSEALFIENNTAHAVPLLLAALARAGRKPEDVRYLIVTHAHLDHAGGSSALMRACPNATLLAHPRAAPHLIDPSKLVASAKQVYGEHKFVELYGAIEPIPGARVRAMGDGEELRFGSRTLRFMHTRGHANHHFCVLDSGSGEIFTGDAFGLAYPDLQSNGLFIFPSTSPTDFDPLAARQSIDQIVSCGATRAYLTHFGEITDLREAARQLHSYLDRVEPLYESLIERDRPQIEVEAFLRSFLPASPILDLDIELNAAGMIFAAQKVRKKRREQ